MNAQEVGESLEILQTQLQMILDPFTAERALARARQDASASESLYYQYRNRTDIRHEVIETGWGFSINEPALRFEETDVKGYPFRVDIICEFRWKGDLPCRRNIVMRLWALNPCMMYREEWDAQDTIGEWVTGGRLGERVMVRFHFDTAEEGLPELKYHVQVGGVQQSNEYCWLHPRIDVPRLPYPPVDLFLICELVGMNFYGRQYDRIHTDATWRGQILKSQRTLLEEYYAGCLQAIRDGRNLLIDHLSRLT